MKVKKLFHKVILLAATILILAACGGKSQAKEPDFPSTSFVSSTELFKVYVPTGWKTEEVVPGADIIMANSEAALEHYQSEGALESGELVLNIGFLPLSLFQEQALAHLDIQIEASPEVFLRSILPMFLVEGEPAKDVAGPFLPLFQRQPIPADLANFRRLHTRLQPGSLMTALRARSIQN